MEIQSESDLDAKSLSPQTSEKNIELSSELESILCNKEVPLFRRLKKAAWVELKVLLHLAAPAIGVYMVGFGMSTSTQIISGHLGNLELAAASLGNNGIQMFAYGILVCHQVYSLCVCARARVSSYLYACACQGIETRKNMSAEYQIAHLIFFILRE